MTIQTIQPAMQAFVSADTVKIYPYQSAPDFNNDRIFVYSRGGLLCRFGISTGVQFGMNTLIAGSPGGAAPYSACVDNQGYIYMPYDLANFTGISKIDPTSLEIFSFFGVSSSTDNIPAGYPGLPVMCSPNANGIPFVFALSSIDLGDEALSAYALNATPAFGGANFSVGGASGPGANGAVCAAQVGNTGVGFSLLTPSISNQNQLYVNATVITQQGALYDPSTWPSTNPGVTNSTTGAVPATAVDSTWVQISTNGILYDESDGNLIINVSGGDASGHSGSYLVKIDRTTCAVIWKVATPGGTVDIDCFGFSSVKHGRLAYFLDGGFPPAHQILFIDTATGASFTSTAGIQGVTALGAQYFNDTLGAIFAYVSFSQGADSPVLLNGTPSSFSGWAAIYVMERYTPPFVPGGRQTYTKIWGAPAAL